MYLSQMFYSYNEAKICLRRCLYLNVFKMLPHMLQYLLCIYCFATMYLLITNVLAWTSIFSWLSISKRCKACEVNVRKQPRYISISIKGRKQQDTKTAANAVRCHINQEINFHYKRKQHFNQQLYQTCVGVYQLLN